MRSSRPQALVALALVLGGCGKNRDEGVSASMALEIPSALATTIDRLRLTIYDGHVCNGPDHDGGDEIKAADVSLTETTTIKVSPGERTFYVEAFGGDVLVARGCEQRNLAPMDMIDLTITLEGGCDDPRYGDSCDGPDSDSCDEGVYTCNPGDAAAYCDDTSGDILEVCNGMDDDCDGDDDEDWPALGSSCTTTCGGSGVTTCQPSGQGTECHGYEICGDGMDGDCLGGPDPACPGNDGPTTAGLITGSTTIVDTFEAARDDVTPTCAAGGGRDVFYEVQVGSRQPVYFDTFGSDYDTALAILVGPCAALGAEVACDNDSCGEDESQVAATLDPGTYCLVVDEGTISFTPTNLQLNVTYGDRDGIGVDGSDTVESGDTCGGPNTGRPACVTGPNGAPDVGYWFTVCPGTTSLTAETCGAVSWNSALVIRSDTATGPDLACQDAGCGGGEGSQVSADIDGPGLRWVILDGRGSACGAYDLTFDF